MIQAKEIQFGMVGLGRFGQCWAKLLLPFSSLKAYDPAFTTSPIEGVTLASLEEVARAEIIFLLVPISSFRECCQKIATQVRPSTLIVDVCSVKMLPLQIMREIFSPLQPLMATHPLFGPDSIAQSGGMEGHQIVLCTEAKEALAEKMVQLFQQIGLQIISLSAQEHDEQMASTQALAHFIGRAPILLNQKQILSTPSFQLLQSVAHMVIQDREELFFDMHRYNPFARLAREQLLEQLSTLHHKLNGLCSKVNQF